MDRGDVIDETGIASALREAATDAGYHVANLELLRVGNNYIFADRSNEHLYRVPVLPVEPDSLTQENERFLKLAEAGAPILPPRQREPLHLSGSHLATVWPLGAKPDPKPSVALAPLLASLHQVAPVDGLPVWEGFERGHRRIKLARSGGVPSELVDEVDERLRQLEADFPDWSIDTLVHGDPHLGNLVKTKAGHLLIDLDDLALGCPEIDLAPMRTSYNRFEAVPGSWETYLGAYGRPIDDELLGWFVKLRQLTMVAWLFTLWDLRAESRDEAVHRVTTLDEMAKWSPL